MRMKDRIRQFESNAQTKRKSENLWQSKTPKVSRKNKKKSKKRSNTLEIEEIKLDQMQGVTKRRKSKKKSNFQKSLSIPVNILSKPPSDLSDTSVNSESSSFVFPRRSRRTATPIVSLPTLIGKENYSNNLFASILSPLSPLETV